MISENILSGVISGVLAPVILLLIFYTKDKCKVKYRIIQISTGSDTDHGDRLAFVIESLSKNFIHLSKVLIVISNKYCCGVSIQDFYLDNSSVTYNNDYYMLPPSHLLNVKLMYTASTLPIIPTPSSIKVKIIDFTNHNIYQKILYRIKKIIKNNILLFNFLGLCIDINSIARLFQNHSINKLKRFSIYSTKIKVLDDNKNIKEVITLSSKVKTIVYDHKNEEIFLRIYEKDFLSLRNKTLFYNEELYNQIKSLGVKDMEKKVIADNLFVILQDPYRNFTFNIIKKENKNL